MDILLTVPFVRPEEMGVRSATSCSGSGGNNFSEALTALLGCIKCDGILADRSAWFDIWLEGN